MKIRNAVIITDANSELCMSLDEQPNFTGNVIFSRDRLPSALAADLDRVTGHSSKIDSAGQIDAYKAQATPHAAGRHRPRVKAAGGIG